MNADIPARPLQAISCVLAAMALFGLIDNFMAAAAETGGLWQFHLLRALIALSVIALVAGLGRFRLRPFNPRAVVLRSILTSVSMVIYFGCLGFMPMAQAVAGLFTAPLWVVILQALIWRETPGPKRVLAVLVGFLGILLVLRPDQAGLGPATVFPVLAGAIYGFGNIVTRRWCGGEPTLSMLTTFFCCMVVWGAVGLGVLAIWQPDVPNGADGFVLRGWTAPTGVFGIMILVQGLGSMIGVGLSIRAYQLADATLVAVFDNTLLLFATLWAFALWRVWPDGHTIWGLALIAGAGALVALRSQAPAPVRATDVPD